MNVTAAERTSEPQVFNPCILIPVYNHEKAVGSIVERLINTAPIILVDDGSSEICRKRLESIAEHYDSVSLIQLPLNQGKGGAMKAGFQYVLQQGFSHALQIDADGQHNTQDAVTFIDQGQKHPRAIICGYPIYDDSVPALRYYARYLTHVWIWINSLSFAVKDSMCGYRLYPLRSTVDIIDTETTGNRMDFDSEIMVHWVWRNLPVINQPTKVSYPEDGISHFAPWRDNYLISKMHTTLFFGMLLRLPKILRRRMQDRRRTHPCHNDGFSEK
ncbi:glycosyltransferase family 2 protein [Pseudomaricurvus sp.]|uniref:glycosyltransferase family 2 protein n=1 Tax=Pseudomaricurvus sp. TaxID=2004510 RepID=UPI003F6A9BBB